MKITTIGLLVSKFFLRILFLTFVFFISFSQLSGQPLCNGEFTFYHSTHNADSVHFGPAVGTAQHYYWSFGDGSHSTNQDPWHFYAPGS